MKIISGRLKGFTGIKKGLGLDEVLIDLSGLKGLIAFNGVNGCGKTTVLENLQPYRTLASRKGALAHHVYLRDAEKEVCLEYGGALYRTLVKIDAESGRQEGFIWRNGVPQVNGKATDYDRYISELLGSENMFFHSIFCAQDSDKLSDMTTSQFKGLLSEFLGLHRYIEMEDASKGCAQVLFSRRTKIEAEIEKCRSIIFSCTQLERVELEGISDEKAHFRAYLASRKVALLNQESAKLLIAESIPCLRSEIEAAKLQAGKNKILRDQLQKLADTKPDIELELSRNIEDSNAELQILRVKAQAIILEISEAEKILQDKPHIIEASQRLADITEALAQKRTALDVAQSLYAAVQAQAGRNETLRTQLAKLQESQPLLAREIETGGREAEANIVGYQRKLQEISDRMVIAGAVVASKEDVLLSRDRRALLATDLDVKRQEHKKAILNAHELKNDLVRLATQVEACTSMAAGLDEKNQDPDCTSTVCGYIKDARDAAARLPFLEKDLLFLEGDSSAANNQVMQLADDITSLENAMREEDKTASLLPEIERAEALIIELGQREKEIREEGEISWAKWVKHRTTLYDKALALENEIERLLSQIDLEADEKTGEAIAKISGLKTDIQKLVAAESKTRMLAGRMNDVLAAEGKIESLKHRKDEIVAEGVAAKQRWDEARILIENRLRVLEDEILSVSRDIDNLVESKVETLTELLAKKIEDIEAYQKVCDDISSEISGLEVRERELARQEEILAGLMSEMQKATREISEWQYLQFACGKDGLRALEIDGAAPAISSFANDLLSESYGAGFSVRISTQDDDGSEILDVMVMHDDSNEEVLLERLSGGQKVWVLKALKLGIVCLSKERSGRDYKTLLCDEEDGSLSSENAKNFIRLYRSTLQKTGMEDCIFISHRPEALALADHRLVFNGGIHVE